MVKHGIKARIGCWGHERWRTECALSPWLSSITGIHWVDLCNRNERLEQGDDPDARVCIWPDSSPLTVARIFPRTGGRLLAHCLREWPLHGLSSAGDAKSRPDISVVIPVGGRDRLESFPAVLGSFLGQRKATCEIIVVEHAREPLFGFTRATDVRYVHLGMGDEDGFNKSACLNEGVRHASADRVLLHDADVVVPADYVARLCLSMARGYEAIRPIRLLFHLGEQESRNWIRGDHCPGNIDFIQQNNPGLSTAVLRSVYWEIGGHDERFVGWGGEDLEFLDRLRLRRLYRGAYAPAIHLWHPSAPKKVSGDRNMELLTSLRGIAPQDRIVTLKGYQHLQS